MIALEQDINLDDLINSKKEIEEKIEIDTKLQQEESIIYPLFKNYPNGSKDYYLKLKSIKFQEWKDQLRILFVDNTLLGDKYFSLLKNLNCKISKNSTNYNLIISNDPQKVSELMTEAPIIYVNCKPSKYTNNKIKLFFFDNKKYFEKYQFYFYANEVECMYRQKTIDFIDAISRIKEML